MGARSEAVEEKLARIASDAHGVVTRRELLAVGVTSRQIARRLGTGALIPAHPGVYRVGHAAPSLEARYLAAVKACGEGALLTGRSAALLLRLTKERPPPPEVTVSRHRRGKGIRVRHSPDIARDDAWVYRGIPVTSVPRTLVDLAAALSLDVLARACHEAGVKHRTTPAQVKRVLARCPNTPGAGKLRLIFEGDVPVTLSKLERRFLSLLKKHRLPLPQTNRTVGGRRVDCRWPEHRLTVELDSYTYHHSRHAWEQDRRRERGARARGDEFRRYSWADVVEQPGAMLAELVALLS